MVPDSLNLQNYSDIHYDSRKIIPGSVFVAIKGEATDGHLYLEQALSKGAKLLVVQQGCLQDELKERLEKDGAEILTTQDTRLTLAELANKFYGEPVTALKSIAVTGTNGKTTVTHILQSILNHAGKSCALIGTMGLKKSSQNDYQDLGNTTPQSRDTLKILAKLKEDNFEYLTMEVSSHALEQQRVACINFKGGIVTNLTQDHLDYHLTMSNYFAAKAKLFKQVKDYVVLNHDDEYYKQFKEEAEKFGLKIINFSLENDQADLFAYDLHFGEQGLSYKLKTKQGNASIKMQLNSLFNVYNSLAAIAACLEEGLELSYIAEAIKNVEVVAGRFEVIKNAQSPFCIVDYAHSPDGLLNVLKGAKRLITKQSSKLICIFGCGGDRDITKRPQMGKIAYELADEIYITSDNPRSEDPEQIIADILTGIPEMSKVKVIADRASAIEQAIKNAHPQDYVVIAGKGHENYQILKDKTIHFDDREQVQIATGN